MVVPAEAPVSGWTAKANASVSVRASTGEYIATSGADGAFTLALLARPASRRFR